MVQKSQKRHNGVSKCNLLNILALASKSSQSSAHFVRETNAYWLKIH